MTSFVAQIREKEEQKGPETAKETETKKKKKKIWSSLKIGAIRVNYETNTLKMSPWVKPVPLRKCKVKSHAIITFIGWKVKCKPDMK